MPEGGLFTIAFDAVRLNHFRLHAGVPKDARIWGIRSKPLAFTFGLGPLLLVEWFATDTVESSWDAQELFDIANRATGLLEDATRTIQRQAMELESLRARVNGEFRA